MKVIINFGEKKVVVPCGAHGDLTIGDLIRVATNKYCKLSAANSNSFINSDQVQLRLNNGAVLDPDDRVGDLIDDREELIAIIDRHVRSPGDLSSSVTSSNLSEHERPQVLRHEVIVTDADLRTRSLRVKNDPTSNIPTSSTFHGQMMTRHRTTYSPPTHDPNSKHLSSDDIRTMPTNIHDGQQTGEKIFTVVLPKENSPLGIHVVPASTDEQHVNGLVLQNIEADGRVQRQGILQINDRIVEINRTNIERCSFDRAQLVFRTALLETELELKIVRSTRKPPIPPKSNSLRASQSKSRPTLAEIQPNNVEPSFIDHDSNLNALNTRRLGKIVKINLTKGTDGLGFKLASRDNPTGAANPIYVKTIFSKGAAIDDGRLQRGDRLLAVNSIDVTQMSLQETVALLRDTRVGDNVELCISRQSEGSTHHDSTHEDIPIHENSPTREIKGQPMTFDIPLNDTSSAGLGITLKGKTSIIRGKTVDLGIFVKSILTGGAASRDNRLRPNDQILAINDSSLANLSNLDAAAILHEAVRREIHPGYIKVTIRRFQNVEIDPNSSEIRETDLSPLPTLTTINNDENELDLTNFVPSSVHRKVPSKEKLSVDRHSSPHRVKKIQQIEQNKDDELDRPGSNPFDRETVFRQSISEKRRLTTQPNKQVIQWKQRSFHESRTHPSRKSYPICTAASVEILAPVIDLSDDDDDEVELKHKTRRSEQPMRVGVDNSSTPTLIRSSSFESIQMASEEPSTPLNEDEGKRKAKLRARTCNDSFRQAVDKSYDQNTSTDLTDEKFGKSEKQRFRFTNLFSNKSKRREISDEKPMKSIPDSPGVEHRPILYPPPAYSSKTNSSQNTPFFYPPASSHEQQGYQPYYFDSNVQTSQKTTIPGKSSLSINLSKATHPPIPRQFLHMNINGSQSLKYNLPSHRPAIPNTTNPYYPSVR